MVLPMENVLLFDPKNHACNNFNCRFNYHERDIELVRLWFVFYFVFNTFTKMFNWWNVGIVQVTMAE